MNKARGAPQMAVIGQRPLVLGGQFHWNADWTVYSTIEELSLEDWTWSIMDVEMKRQRSFFSAVVVPGKMVSP